ncbi:hypothetical protein BgiBS90_003113, partial [Biomphalaria glabrata]
VSSVKSHTDVSSLKSCADVSSVKSYRDVSSVKSYTDVSSVKSYTDVSSVKSYTDVSSVKSYTDVSSLKSYTDAHAQHWLKEERRERSTNSEIIMVTTISRDSPHRLVLNELQKDKKRNLPRSLAPQYLMREKTEIHILDIYTKSTWKYATDRQKLMEWSDTNRRDLFQQ